MVETKNISPIAAAKLCNTCGACFGVCPAEAIRYRETMGGYFFPEVNQESCISCGVCLEVCPGIHFGKTLLSSIPQDPFSGLAMDVFVGKATSPGLFDNSQSGGIVSALLVHALKKKQIKGAATVVMQWGNPPRPIAQIAGSSDEIFRAQKSKYCPVPLLGLLKDLKAHDGPIALVGTSCHIHGLMNVLDKMPGLQSRIAFTIGLVCERVLTNAALDYFIARALEGNENTHKMLHFKDKSLSGYPGDVHVLTENGDSTQIPFRTRMEIKDYFTPARCRLCFDKMNIFSDITVGDPHGLTGVDRRGGESMLVVRTAKGRNVVQSAIADQAIQVRRTAYGQILEGQDIRGKKKQWHAYIKAWKQSGRELPGCFEQVKDNTLEIPRGKRYSKDLEYSLSLDDFVSREELFRSVDYALRKKRAVNSLTWPLRLAGKALRQLKRTGA